MCPLFTGLFTTMGKSIVLTVTTDLNHDQRMLRIAGTLASAGFVVTLLGRELPGSKPLVGQHFQQVRLRCRLAKGPFFYLEFNLRLILWFLWNRFEIYGGVDADTALAGVLTAWWRRQPFVYDAHELFPELPEVVNRPPVKAVWAWVEKLAFSRASLAYTVSGSLVEYFQQRYRRRVHLIRNMPFRQPGVQEPGQPVYFIYQGALNVGRGLEATLEAMQDVPAQLVICGDGPLLPALQERVQQLNLSRKVIFKGNVAPASLAQITQQAYAGIMLLENQGLSYYYSLANKFFDYVQAGIPQICIPFPEYERLNTEWEVALLTNNNPEDIRKSMLALLEGRETYQRLRHNCLRARQEWVWEKEAERLVHLYKELA